MKSALISILGIFSAKCVGQERFSKTGLNNNSSFLRFLQQSIFFAYLTGSAYAERSTRDEIIESSFFVILFFSCTNCVTFTSLEKKITFKTYAFLMEF